MTSPITTNPPSSTATDLPHPENACEVGRRSYPVRQFLLSPAAHAVVLLLMVAACFGRTIKSGYFIADDPAQIAYACRAVTTNPELLWHNMSGNYMGVPGMAVWRPVLFLSMVTDFLVWKTNSAGYYLTNFAYFSGSVVLLYAVVRLITARWTAARSSLAAFLSAALFALNPLRCESVSWVVGRVDIICGFFYLLSLWLSFRLILGEPLSRRKHAALLSASLLFYFVALMSKEMAIGLPLLVSAGALLLPRNGESTVMDPPATTRRIRIVTLFWAVTAAYFAMRFLALGTLIGGYSSEHGASSLAGLLSRWSDKDTLVRLFVPLVNDIFANKPIYKSLLDAGYAVSVFLLIIRLVIAPRFSWRWAALFLTWILSCAIPIYQLWGLGYNLESSRFYWFLSFPLSIILPFVLLYPLTHATSQDRQKKGLLERMDNRLAALGTLALCGLLAIMSRATYQTNALWVHAGGEVNRFATACRKLADSSSDGEKIVIFGMPKDNAGAHLILNMHMFNCLLSPPFTRTVLADRFVLFEPVLFSPDHQDYVNADRLSSTLADRHVSGPFIWSRQSMSFVPASLQLPQPGGPNIAVPPIKLNLPDPTSQIYTPGHVQTSITSTAGSGLRLSRNRAGDGILFSQLDINPLQYGCLEFVLRTDRPIQNGVVTVSWTGTTSLGRAEAALENNVATTYATCNQSLKPLKVRVPLSHFQRWFYFQKIEKILLQLPGADLHVSDVQLLPVHDLLPRIAVSDGKLVRESCDNGVYLVTAGQPVTLSVTNLRQDARRISLEISKTNHFFDNFPADSSKAIGSTKVTNLVGVSERGNLNSSIGIETDKLGNGYYQFRVRAHARKESTEYSEPITIQVTR